MFTAAFNQYVNANTQQVFPVVEFNSATDRLYTFDLTATNTELTDEILSNSLLFSNWISKKLTDHNSRYGIGGYKENRTIYRVREHFDSTEEPRTLHLGTDIWAPAETVVYSPLNAKVHSYKFNDAPGDYGATIILEHSYPPLTFYTLYGHLSLASLNDLYKGKHIRAGEKFATLGKPEENGYWPPHLHFQIIRDMEGFEGDYPGVCGLSQAEKYLNNCPDPEIILIHTFE